MPDLSVINMPDVPDDKTALYVSSVDVDVGSLALEVAAPLG